MSGSARRVRAAALVVMLALVPALISVSGVPSSGAEPWPVTAPSCSASYPVGSSPPRVLDSIDLLTPVGLGQVHAHGWVVDQDAPGRTLWVRAWTDRGFDRVVAANGDRPDVAAAVPGAGPAHGFDVVIDVGEGSSIVALQTYRDRPEQSLVLTWCTAVVPQLPPVGYLEQASSPAPNSLHVTGWAIDPSTPGEAVDIDVYAGGRGWSTGPANRIRPDVGALSPLVGPAHGFDVVLTGVPAGTQQVCAFGINRGPTANNPQLGCQTVTVADRPPDAPFGVVEFTAIPGTNGVRVGGWALDPDQPDQPVRINVYVGGLPGAGRGVDVGPALLLRTDVAQAYAGLGAGDRHGFDVSVGRVPAGPTDVCVFALDVAGVHHSLLRCTVIDVPPAPADPIGDLNNVTSPAPGQVTVQGWALQQGAPSAGLTIHAWVDGPPGTGTGHDLGPAGLARDDVAAAYAGIATGANHGFQATFDVPAGTHQVCVYAIGQGAATGNNPLLDCRLVVVG